MPESKDEAQVLERLLLRLVNPPDDGGVWTSKKVAAWLAGQLGLVSVGVQRGLGGVAGCGLVGSKAAAEKPEGCNA
jgi:hypothetical protein